MKDKKEHVVVLPVGRLVMGSLYDPGTKDYYGNDRVFKSGKDEGKPKPDFFFGLAIKKGTETSFNQSAWGKEIWAAAHELWPRGDADKPDFAWKISDGDDATPNKDGYRPCDREGYAGHWIVKLSSAFAPPIWSNDISKRLSREDLEIVKGDYVHVALEVSANQKVDNPRIENPGVALRHKAVCFVGRGEPIVLSAQVDPRELGMGSAKLPDGVMPYVPGSDVAKFVTQAPAPTLTPAPVPPSAVQVTPHATILTPPPMPTPTPARVMTEKALGNSYEKLKLMGWTDDALVAEGMMVL